LIHTTLHRTPTGQVLAQCKPPHRHQEFLGFLRAIEAAVPPDLDVHLIVDNYSTHKHPKAKPGWRLAPAGICTSCQPAARG
jgi:hypothetical protein